MYLLLKEVRLIFNHFGFYVGMNKNLNRYKSFLSDKTYVLVKFGRRFGMVTEIFSSFFHRTQNFQQLIRNIHLTQRFPNQKPNKIFKLKCLLIFKQIFPKTYQLVLVLELNGVFLNIFQQKKKTMGKYLLRKCHANLK